MARVQELGPPMVPRQSPGADPTHSRAQAEAPFSSFLSPSDFSSWKSALGICSGEECVWATGHASMCCHRKRVNPLDLVFNSRPHSEPKTQVETTGPSLGVRHSTCAPSLPCSVCWGHPGFPASGILLSGPWLGHLWFRKLLVGCPREACARGHVATGSESWALSPHLSGALCLNPAQEARGSVVPAAAFFDCSRIGQLAVSTRRNCLSQPLQFVADPHVFLVLRSLLATCLQVLCLTMPSLFLGLSPWHPISSPSWGCCQVSIISLYLPFICFSIFILPSFFLLSHILKYSQVFILREDSGRSRFLGPPLPAALLFEGLIYNTHPVKGQLWFHVCFPVGCGTWSFSPMNLSPWGKRMGVEHGNIAPRPCSLPVFLNAWCWLCPG